MKLQNKNILIVSPEPWTHLFVSKHHYARHLAMRGNNVWFLNPPSHTAKVTTTDIPSLQVLDYRGFPPGMRHYPAFLRRRLTRRAFQQLEKRADVAFDVLWSFDNSVFYQMDALPESVLKISHVVDLNQDFETERAASTANICFCVSRNIQSRLEQFAPGKVHWINHGLSLFEHEASFEIKNGFNLNAGYAGNLDIPYLDWAILLEVIDNHPNIGFHFVGKLSDPRVKIFFETRPNMLWHGILRANQLQSFYTQMDVLLIAYQADTYREQLANPHKMLEYLFSSKPIVATYTAEYADKELIYMSKTNKEWGPLFKQVVSNLDKYTSKALAEKRRSFALENTYDKQIDRIEKILTQND